MEQTIINGPSYTLYHGDALDILPGLSGVAAIITDPPYMINTKSDGNGKLSPWADLCNAALWYATWIKAARHVLLTRGCLWTCLNWRSMTTFQKALCDIRWSFASMMVWDKVHIGVGSPNQLRARYEMVGLCAMPDFAIADRKQPDIVVFPWATTKPHGHPAEKPEALMRHLIEISTKPGDLVVDPFMGSGTTGAAALALGRRFVGVEQDMTWYEYAAKRIAAVEV